MCCVKLACEFICMWCIAIVVREWKDDCIGVFVGCWVSVCMFIFSRCIDFVVCLRARLRVFVLDFNCRR